MPLLTYCRFEVDSRVTTQIPARYWKLLAALQVFRSRLPALGWTIKKRCWLNWESRKNAGLFFWTMLKDSVGSTVRSRLVEAAFRTDGDERLTEVRGLKIKYPFISV